MPDDSLDEVIDQDFDTEGLPDFYADGYRFASTPFTINLLFAVGTGLGESRNVAIVRMSPSHAKVMAILFKRNVLSYEERFGIEIPVPQALIDRHNIDLDRDWLGQGEG